MIERRTLIGLLLAAVLLTVGVRLALPWVLRNAVVHQVEQALDARVELADLDLSLWTGAVDLEGLRIASSESPAEPRLSAERVRLRIEPRALLAGRIALAELRLEGAELRLDRDASGALSWGVQGFASGEAPQAAATPVDVASISVGAARVRVHEPDGAESVFEVASAQLRDLRLGGEPEWALASVELEGLRLVLALGPEGLELGGRLRVGRLDAAGQQPTPLELELHHGEGRFTAEGNVSVAAGSASLALAWQELELPALLAALAPGAAEQITLRAGRASGEVEAELVPAAEGELGRVSLRGRARVDDADLSLPGAGADLGWKQLEAELAEVRFPLDGAAPVLRLDRLRIDSPAVHYTLSDPAPADGDAGPAARVVIAVLEVDDGLLRVIDPAAPDAAVGVSGARLRARGLRTPALRFEELLLAASGPGGPLSLEGRLAEGKGSFAFSGETLSLTAFAPLLAAHSTYRVTKGNASFEGRVEIEADAYRAPTRLKLHDLGLETADAGESFLRQFGMPPALALALLRDAKREIALELPVAGSRSGARVTLWPVLTGALRDAMLNALQKPLALLGSVIIRDGRLANFDLDAIEFAPGSSELSAAAAQPLVRTAEVLTAHPELHLELVPLLVPADSRALGGSPGSDALRSLSAARASAVAAGLARAGVAPERVASREGPPALAAGAPRVQLALDAEAASR